MPPLEDEWGDDVMDAMDTQEGHVMEYQTDDGQWHPLEVEEEGDWVEEEDVAMTGDVISDDVEMTSVGSSDESSGRSSQEMPGAWQRKDQEQVDDLPKAAEALPASVLEHSSVTWARFDVQPSAPADHAFYSNAPTQPSRQFMSRLSKEYRALSTSLPGREHLALFGV